MYISQHDRRLAAVLGFLILCICQTCLRCTFWDFARPQDPGDIFFEDPPTVSPRSVLTDAYQLILYELLEYWKRVANIVLPDPVMHTWFSTKLQERVEREITEVDRPPKLMDLPCFLPTDVASNNERIISKLGGSNFLSSLLPTGLAKIGGQRTAPNRRRT